MKLYVYCIVDNLDTWNSTEPGVAGASVRLIKIDEIAVLVSDCEIDNFSATRENALAHAVVVRNAFVEETPLPFRFGTLISEQQLRNYVQSHKQAIENKLAHVRGCAEMNVRVTWGRATDEVAHTPESKHAAPHGPGTAFLADKRREILGDERSTAQAAELSDLLREYVGSFIRDEQISLRPSETVILAKVDHLVERPTIQNYREQMAKGVRERPELHFLVSGPWPPYSFANIELEFPMQFGVT